MSIIYYLKIYFIQHLCASLHRLRAPGTRSSQMFFIPVPGNHRPWVQQWKKQSRPWEATPPPPVFDISTRNHFAPLCETERDTVIVGDSIVWHVRAMLTEGKVHTHCFPGARVLDVSAQKPRILKDDAHINVKLIYSAFSCSRCDSRGGERHQAAADGDTEVGL